MKYAAAILGVILVLIVAVAFYSVDGLYQSRHFNLVLQKQASSLNQKLKIEQVQLNQQKTTQPSLQNQIQSLAPNGNDVKEIIYDQYGFDPNIDTVPLGSLVSIKNETKVALTIKALDFFGRNLVNSPLNLGTVQPQQEKSFTLNIGAETQYQANNNPAIRAEIGTQ